MPHIRPISDLRNHFADISKLVHETQKPVFLTKNGHGDMVVMSMELYEKQMAGTEHSNSLKKIKEEDEEIKDSQNKKG